MDDVVQADGDPRDRRARKKVVELIDRARPDLGSHIPATRKRGIERMEKAQQMQLDHFAKTGRWLLDVPPRHGWYPDPSGRHRLRYYRDGWLPLVSDGRGNQSDDPDGVA